MAGFFRKFTKGFLLLCNLVVAVLFLLGCYVSYFDPARFVLLSFLNLASLYFLVILAVFFLFWLLTRRKFALISLVAALLAWQPMAHLIRFRTSKEFTKEKQPGALRVMSWNVEHFDILEHRSHPERKKEMLDLVKSFSPDVACFQEMVGSEEFPDAINYVPGIAKDLNFSHRFYTYNPKLDFDGKHHFGIIIFSKYPIVNQQTVSFEPRDYNSIFQYADIKKDNDTFRVFNIHLQSLKFSDANLKYIDDPAFSNSADITKSRNVLSKMKTGYLRRKLQSERIKAEVDKSPYPVIICGDFNDLPNSYAYSTIGKGLKNCFAEKGTGIGRTFYYISSTLRIDNIFTDQKFNTLQFKRIKKKLSDHFPVIADLAIDK